MIPFDVRGHFHYIKHTLIRTALNVLNRNSEHPTNNGADGAHSVYPRRTWRDATGWDFALSTLTAVQGQTHKT